MSEGGSALLHNNAPHPLKTRSGEELAMGKIQGPSSCGSFYANMHAPIMGQVEVKTEERGNTLLFHSP